MLARPIESAPRDARDMEVFFASEVRRGGILTSWTRVDYTRMGWRGVPEELGEPKWWLPVPVQS